MLDRNAQVSAKQSSDEFQHLCADRPIESVARTELIDRLGREWTVGTEAKKRIAGGCAHEKKEQRQRDSECDEGLEGAAEQPTPHGLTDHFRTLIQPECGLIVTAR